MPELRRRGRIDSQGSFLRRGVPSGAGPDKGFRHGGRPDLFLAQGASRQ